MKNECECEKLNMTKPLLLFYISCDLGVVGLEEKG